MTSISLILLKGKGANGRAVRTDIRADIYYRKAQLVKAAPDSAGLIDV